MIGGIIIATCVVAGVGIVIGIILGIADLKLHVEVDEKEAAILEALPGNNCGGCGFPGCSGCAAAIAKGEAAGLFPLVHAGAPSPSVRRSSRHFVSALRGETCVLLPPSSFSKSKPWL